MNDIKRELDKLDEQIQEAKKNVSVYEGQGIQLTKQLKEFGYKTVAEAEKDIINMEKELGTLNASIEKIFSELQESYQW